VPSSAGGDSAVPNSVPKLTNEVTLDDPTWLKTTVEMPTEKGGDHAILSDHPKPANEKPGR